MAVFCLFILFCLVFSLTGHFGLNAVIFALFFYIFFFKSIIAVSERSFTAKKSPVWRILAGAYNLPLKSDCLSHHQHCRLT